MNQEIEQIVFIIHKQLSGTPLSHDETVQLENWLAASLNNKKVFDQIMDEQVLDQDLKELYLVDRKSGWSRLRQRINEHPVKFPSKYNWRKLYSIAAAVAIIIITGVYFLTRNNSASELISSEPSQKIIPVNDIQPGKDGAILTLADGRQILLDEKNNGLLAQESNSSIIKKGNEIVYDASSSTSTDLVYNTITTTRAQQLPSLVLSDGSKVWLNSASSIRFPVAFGGNERKVEVTGEAYFEVAKNTSKPFRVVVNEGMTIEVTGTEFNVNAYEDESSIRTTLIEGNIKIVSSSSASSVRPGEQAELVRKTNSLRLNRNVDTYQVIAWKQGLFVFNNTDLQTVMRQISRWYDVDIVFQGKPTEVKLGGGISKKSPLSEVLSALESAGMQFKMDGKKLIVL